MKSSHRVKMTLAILTIVTSASAFGQIPPVGGSAGERSSVQELDERSQRYFVEDPSSDSHSRDRTSRLLWPATGSIVDDFPGLSASWFEVSHGRAFDSTPAGQLVPRSPEISPPRDQGSQEIRYRISLISRSINKGFGQTAASDLTYVRIGDRPEGDGFRGNQFESTNEWMPARGDSRRSRSYFPWRDPDSVVPAPTPERGGFLNDEIATIRSQDPFVPAPLPDSLRDQESSAIDEIITIRYQNPVTVRAIRAISLSQAVQLFAEVSQKIDERSLDPTSYDVRVRRALRNLTIALDNEAFLDGLGLSADSFQLDGYRNTLARLAGAGQVQDYQEALSVLNAVMTETQVVTGLAPGVVGFEFANASIDTLDQFSGLEPADPALRNGAENNGRKSHVLEEQLVGIGLEVREHAEGLLVVKPLRGGPAAEAGIEPGDIILSIDGRDVRGMKIASSVDLLKGPSGSQMKIRMYRAGQRERDIVLTRRIVRVWTVNDAKILSGTDVGYFSLSRFSQNSTAEVDQALNSLHNEGMKSLIIDLRDNPGGLLTTCVDISDRFVACGTIVSTKGRLSSDNMIQQATYSRTWSVPVVVLVNGDSASASEIFAAAIQENDRGLVVGTRSYGKGSVQTHFSLSSIEGDLRLTTALFYSPNGRRMSGKGVLPDVEVDDRDGVLNGDEVLDEAVRIAQSEILRDMAKASGTCRQRNPAAPRSSSLNDIVDPSHPGTIVL